jgi:malonyl-CoA O-methyltransferase
MEPTRRAIDDAALSRQLRRLAATADPPWLHGEVARRMGERLPVVKLQPERVIDWWAWLGASRAVLDAAYPKAHQTLVEPLPALVERSRSALARPWWSRWGGRRAEVLSSDDVNAGSAQLLWANMMLHAVADPQLQMRQWQRALVVDGFLMFSTLGPGSLDSLRALYAQAGWSPPHAPFVDMHDLGDMLVHAGFADPVMDQEVLTLTWATPQALLAELRALGGNADPARAPGLRTPRWRRELEQRLDSLRGPDGRLRLGFELVYGHAFRPAPRPKVAGTTTLPLDDLRSMVRAGRTRG